MFEGVLPFPPLSKLQSSSLRAKIPGYNSQLSKPIYSIVAFEATSRFPGTGMQFGPVKKAIKCLLVFFAGKKDKGAY